LYVKEKNLFLYFMKREEKQGEESLYIKTIVSSFVCDRFSPGILWPMTAF
jgi:hypothetical protein